MSLIVVICSAVCGVGVASGLWLQGRAQIFQGVTVLFFLIKIASFFTFLGLLYFNVDAWVSVILAFFLGLMVTFVGLLLVWRIRIGQ